jgi:hypothetical protein
VYAWASYSSLGLGFYVCTMKRMNYFY